MTMMLDQSDPSSPFGHDPFASAAPLAHETPPVEDTLPDEAARRTADQQAKLDRIYPKPDEMDVLTIKNTLDGVWQEWRTGTLGPAGSRNADVGGGDYENGSGPTDGIPGLTRVRAMRYHRDRQPAKYQRYMNTPYRWRSNLTASELDRTVALATRNPPKFKIAPGSRAPEAADVADRETRWAQYLWPTLEKQAGLPLLRMFADGVFEGGLAGFEIYLTDGYDGLDLDQQAEENDQDYLERTDDALMRASARRLPVGIRVPDPLAILIEMDDLGVKRYLCVENKPYVNVFEEFTRKRTVEEMERLKLPNPGTPGFPEYYDNGWGSPSGNVLTIRYYDRRWYGFMVAGKWVDGPEEHGMPGVPFIPCFGNVTSSSRTAERIHGIADGMVEQEQVINDFISQGVDIAFTYGRPKPYIETMVGGQLRDPATGPTTVKLGNPDEAPELGEGQRLKDAFEGFQSRFPPQLLQQMMAIRAQNGMSAVSAGESPGSDPSGFAVNTLQAAGQMRYEIYLDNISRAIGEATDFVRQMIKGGPINDKVFVPVMNANGEMEYLGLGPDDITDMPSLVFIDPMNDVNRLAIRQSLIAGNQAGYIPRDIVQTQGFGADDARMWDNQIAEDVADQQLLAMALEVAKQRVAMSITPQPAPGWSGLVDSRGNPISSTQPQAGDSNELASLGGIPREDRGTGRMGRSDGGLPPAVSASNEANAARSRGGQQPAGQGIPANTTGPTQ